MRARPGLDVPSLRCKPSSCGSRLLLLLGRVDLAQHVVCVGEKFAGDRDGGDLPASAVGDLLEAGGIGRGALGVCAAWFMIQRSQNKESKALNLKLNELIAAVEGSSNRLIDVESLSEREMATLAQHYRALVKMAARDDSLLESHTVEEAEARHARKSKPPRSRGR